MTGSKQDLRNISRTFTFLGAEIILLKDVSPTEMITGLKSAAKKAEPEVQWVGVNGDLITRRGIEQEQEPARS